MNEKIFYKIGKSIALQLNVQAKYEVIKRNIIFLPCAVNFRTLFLFSDMVDFVTYNLIIAVTFFNVISF